MIMPPSDSLLDRLSTQLDSLSAILKGVSLEALQRRPPSGKWSAHENLAHIGRYQEVFLDRLHRILKEENPVFERYRVEEDPQAERWMKLSTGEVLTHLRKLRCELVGQMEKLGAAQFSRTAVHPVLGPLSLHLWLEFFLLHQAHHLYLVFKRSRGGD